MKDKKIIRVCVSLYPEDIVKLDKICDKVGFTRSEFFRFIITGFSSDEKLPYFIQVLKK